MPSNKIYATSEMIPPWRFMESCPLSTSWLCELPLYLFLSSSSECIGQRNGYRGWFTVWWWCKGDHGSQRFCLIVCPSYYGQKCSCLPSCLISIYTIVNSTLLFSGKCPFSPRKTSKDQVKIKKAIRICRKIKAFELITSKKEEIPAEK